MPIYLATGKIPTRDAPQGRPSFCRAWVPPGCDPLDIGKADRRWIYLRTDSESALVHLRDPFTHPSLELLADSGLERISASTRNRLNNYLGDRTLNTQDSVRDALASVFMSPPVDGRWGKPLRPNRGLGKYQISLELPGQPAFWESAGPSRTTHTVTLSDNFTGDGNLDGRTASGGGTWAEIEGTALTTLGGRARTTTATFNYAWITTNFDTDDHYAQLTWTAFGLADSRFVGVGVRIEGATGNDGYVLEVNQAGAYRLYKLTDDSTIDSGTVTVALPDTLYLSFDGSAWSFKWNDVVTDSGTDTAFTGHLRALIQHYASSAQTIESDDYLAGDLVAGSSSVSPSVSPSVSLSVSPSSSVSASPSTAPFVVLGRTVFDYGDD